MFDWLWSKMMTAFATIILMSSVSAYFISERDQVVNREQDMVAHSLASFVDSVLDLSGTAKFRIGSDRDDDLTLPQEIGGSLYGIELRRDSVIVNIDGRTAIDHWSGDLHF